MIDDYIKTLEFNGLSKSTVKATRNSLKYLNEYKPLDQVTKNDIMDFFNSIQGKYSDNYIILMKNKIKKFYRDIGKPEIIDWMKVPTAMNHLDENKILTVDDINTLIESADNHMHKALIAVLFETGARIGEVLNLKRNDFDETEGGLIVRIENIKTKKHATAKHRKNLLLSSAVYVRNWISYGNIQNDGHIFKLQEPQAWKILKAVGEKAGIDKPTNPHAFRHAQTTDMVRKKYNETIIRKKLGWTADSKQIKRYAHALDEDVINATREANGNIIIKPTNHKNLIQADDVSIPDTNSIIQKQAAVIEALNEKVNNIEARATLLNEDLIKAMIEARVNEILKNG